MVLGIYEDALNFEIIDPNDTQKQSKIHKFLLSKLVQFCFAAEKDQGGLIGRAEKQDTSVLFNEYSEF